MTKQQEQALEKLAIYLWGRRMKLRTTSEAFKTAEMLMPFLLSEVEQAEKRGAEKEIDNIEKLLSDALGAGAIDMIHISVDELVSILKEKHE